MNERELLRANVRNLLKQMPEVAGRAEAGASLAEALIKELLKLGILQAAQAREVCDQALLELEAMDAESDLRGAYREELSRARSRLERVLEQLAAPSPDDSPQGTDLP